MKRPGKHIKPYTAGWSPFFDGRRCAASEDLADKTLDRVILKISLIKDSYKGNPAPLFYGYAHNVYLEYFQEQIKRNGGPLSEAMSAPTKEEDAKEKERKLVCLDQCLQELPPGEQEMILQYYQEDKRAKVDHRKQMAERFGYSISGLRTKMHRLREEIYDCIMSCLGLDMKK